MIVAAAKTPYRSNRFEPLSALSGMSSQSAISRKLPLMIQGAALEGIILRSHTPSHAETVWLKRVATRIPAMISRGDLKRDARNSDSSWDLSPISATATIAVELNRTSRIQPPFADHYGRKIPVGRGRILTEGKRSGKQKVLSACSCQFVHYITDIAP